MAIKTLRVFQEFTSAGYVPMPVAGNIDYGVTIAGTFPGTTPTTFQTDDPDIDVTLTATTDYYVWIRSHGTDWNPMYTRNVRVYPDSPLVNNVVMGIIIANLSNTVPYTGANANVNLGEYGLTAGYLGLDLTPTGTPTTAGNIYWDAADGTLNVNLLNNVVTHLGGDLPILVKSDSNSGLVKGSVVYQKGSDGANTTVLLAQANAESTSSKTFGIIANTTSGGAKAYCITFGYVRGIDTLALTEGATVYLSPTTAGGYTTTKPQAPNHIVTVGRCIRSHATQGVIFVTIQNGFELDELHDVQITSVANKNTLVYDSATTLWKNRNIFGTQGYIPYYDDTLLMKDSIIYTNGTNVGIGTTTLTEKLVVNGNVLATQFKKVGGLSTEFLKADGSSDATAYQPLSADLTAIDNLALTTGLLRKNGTDTWVLDQTEYLTLANAISTYQRIDNLQSNLTASATKYPSVNAVNSGLALKLNLTGGTLTGGLTLNYSYPNIALSDVSSGTTWNITNDGGAFKLNYGTTNKFYIFSSGNAEFINYLTANKLIKAGGLSTEFLKADGSVDSTTYQPYDADLSAIGALALTTGLLRKNGANTWELDQTEYVALSTLIANYQTISNLSANLTASSTKYPSVNAVNTGLNLKLNLSGGTMSGDLAISKSIPLIQFSDTSSGTIWNLQNNGGGFEINSGITNKFTMYSSGNATFVNDLTANKFIKSGGTSAQFLMADGSVTTGVSNQITGTLTTNYIPKASGTNTIGNSVIQEINGIVGIGSTPSNWDYSGSIQLPSGGIYATRGSNNMLIAGALYNSGWKRNTVGFASMFEQNLGGFTWYTAPSGAGLSDITWQQLMNLNPSGRLLINQTTDDGVNLIQANGAIISTAFKKSGGTSSQFLKADGSVDSSVYITGITSPMVITALGFTPYNATNPSGFISSNQNITLSGDVSGSGPTSITTTLATITQASSGSFVKITLDTKGRVIGNVAVGSSDITSALGYTPYNSTNPSGYISGITSLMVTNALGYTPYNSTNPAGYTNNVGTVTSVAMSVPTGLFISGSPITTSGTLALSLSVGYSIPTTSSQGTWDTAYNRSLTSIGVSGTTTKTLTLTKQDGTTLTASWSDINTDAVTSVFGRTGAIVATSGDYTTAQVTESGNLYYLDSRARASISGGTGISYNSTTGVITNTITQYTDALARASISGGTGISYNSTSGVITNTITQYTDALARASLSFVAGSGAYNSTTGVITIPTNTSQLTNGSGYITGITSLMVTNALGYTPVTNARQLTINGTTYDLSADRSWTISGTIGGLTSGFIPKATSASTLGNSVIYESSGSVYLGSAYVINRTNTGGYFTGVSDNFGLTYDGVSANISNASATPIIFYTSGSEKMRLSSTGNLGIGTTTINVGGWSKAVTLQGSSNAAYEVTDGTVRLATFVSASTIGGVSVETNHPLGFYTNGTERMRLTSGGNLLVGTTTDSGYKLDVNGTARVSGAATFSSSVTATSFIKTGGTSSQYLMADGSVTTSSGGVGGSGTTNYISKWNGTTSLANSQIFDNGTQVTVGSNVTMYKFAVNPVSNSYFGIGYTGTNQIFVNAVDSAFTAVPIINNAYSHSWLIGFGDAMLLNNSGNLLIGTTSGVSGGGKLQVNGDVNINGNFKINGTVIGGGGGSGITGSGTTNMIAKWTGGTSLGDSALYDNGAYSIGIGTTSVSLPSGRNGLVVRTSSFGGSAEILIQQSSNANGTTDGFAIANIYNDGAAIYNRSNAHIRFGTNNTERLRITEDGNLGFGTTSQFGGGVKVIGIANSTTIPNTTPSGGGVLFVQSGALWYIGSSGTYTKIANG